jgi:hypothetical protein
MVLRHRTLYCLGGQGSTGFRRYILQRPFRPWRIVRRCKKVFVLVCQSEFMSITATWSEGVFKPTGEVKGAVPGKAYRVFSEDEPLELT